MNVDKAKKRIAKQVKKDFNGYPLVSLAYFGPKASLATGVLITFTLEENAEARQQRFVRGNDVREDQTVQSILVKIIERAGAATVTEIADFLLIE